MHNNSYFEADTLDDLMAEVFSQLLESTEIIEASRGRFTEIFGAMLVLKDPRARLSRSESRGKIFSALGELFWYLSKTNSHQFIEYYIAGAYKKEIEEDDNSVRNGYGSRLFCQDGQHDQIQNVINTLNNGKRTSRKAVIQLFDASDLTEDFNEIPCTCTLQFLVRNDKLNLLVNMRSNDAYRGLPHDIFAFTMLQELIARSLGIDVGIYKHCAGSLHLYQEIEGKNDHEEARKFLAEGWQAKISMPVMPEGDQWKIIETVRDIERKIRTGEQVDIANSGLNNYWQDICRLFVVFREGKSEHTAQIDQSLTVCRTMREEMSSKVYDMFIASRIEFLESKQKAKK